MQRKYRKIIKGSPHVMIGKKVITPGLIEHIQNLFEHQKIIKIKVQPDTANYYGMERLIEELIEKLRVYVLDARGFTVIISKRKVPGVHIKKKYRKKLTKVQSKTIKNQSLTPTPPPGSTPVEPAFIDYDNEELLEEIDKASDRIYGAPPHRDKSREEEEQVDLEKVEE
jgi:RNA-binding protein YhbY